MQFDVHRNRGAQRAAVPFVVVVQSRAFARYARRLVVPLAVKADFGDRTFRDLTPEFVVEGQRVMLDPLQMQSVACDSLGPVVASLADDASASAIIKSIDLVLSRAWG